MRAVWAARYASAGAALAVVICLAYLSRVQFLAWQGSGQAKYLLPPYQSLGYFLYYVGVRMWAPYALSAAVAIIAYVAARTVNRYKKGAIFEAEEPYFLALGILLAGHPGWVAYIVIAMGAYFAFAGGRWLLRRRSERVSFYRFWLPSAAATVLLEIMFRQHPWYMSLLV